MISEDDTVFIDWIPSRGFHELNHGNLHTLLWRKKLFISLFVLVRIIYFLSLKDAALKSVKGVPDL